MTRIVKPETQIKNLIKQALEKSRANNNGEVVTGKYVFGEVTVIVRRGNQVWFPCARVYHNELGIWSCRLNGPSFNVGKVQEIKVADYERSRDFSLLAV